MAKGAKPKNGTPQDAAAKVVAVRVVLNVTEETPSYYINYAEINFSINEFAISAVKVAPRLNSQRISNIKETGTIEVSADIQLILPPNIIAGLINALSLTKEAYEKQYGIELKDYGGGGLLK